jgi:hypothetical protein
MCEEKKKGRELEVELCLTEGEVEMVSVLLAAGEHQRHQIPERSLKETSLLEEGEQTVELSLEGMSLEETENAEQSLDEWVENKSKE